MEPRINKSVIMISKDEINMLDDYELTILATIRYMFIPKYYSNIEHEFCLNDIIRVLNNNNIFKSDCSIKRKLSKSLKSLLSKDILSVSKVKNNRYYIKRESLLIDSNTLYVSLTFDEFKELFSSNLTSNSIKLCGYYIKLLSTININTKIGFHSIIALSEKFKISEGSVIKYNSELEIHKLIRIFRHKTYNEDTGKFRSHNNMYYKPCDADFLCKKFGRDF